LDRFLVRGEDVEEEEEPWLLCVPFTFSLSSFPLSVDVLLLLRELLTFASLPGVPVFFFSPADHDLAPGRRRSGRSAVVGFDGLAALG